MRGPGRYLLVRPTGGVADMLCQIGRCIDYARRHGRRLIVDTQLPDFFAEPFSTYFTFADEQVAVTELTEQELAILNQLPCRPAEFTGRLGTYVAEQVPPSLFGALERQYGHFVNLRDASTQVPATFDFRCDYAEPVLLHHGSGSETEQALFALRSLRPTSELELALRQALRSLPPRYEALHVRNTDLKSHYQEAVRALDLDAGEPLLVCSDDHEVIAFARRTVRKRHLLIASTPVRPAEFGSGVATTHKDNPGLPRHEVNLSALIDLVCLAGSAKLHTARVVSGQCKDHSGFAHLALALGKDPALRAKFQLGISA